MGISHRLIGEESPVAKAGIEALVKVQADEWDSCQNLRIILLFQASLIRRIRAKTHPGEVKQRCGNLKT